MPITLATRHLLTGSELAQTEITQLLDLADQCKVSPSDYQHVLSGQHLALLFDKPSLRTRFSFTVAMHELGGHVVESVQSTRKAETPEDTIRVIQGYCHGLMIRTFDDTILTQMESFATIPIINGLSNWYHPCQILADLMTLRSRFNQLAGLTLTYIGDGNNILHSLLLMAPKMGINLHYCCPQDYGPHAVILKTAQESLGDGSIQGHTDPTQAVKQANAVYTDVWTSMGFKNKEEHVFSGFQVNAKLMQQAMSDAVLMHCMPIERGKEVSNELPDLPNSVIFTQSENRLYVQKAVLLALLTKEFN